MTTAHTGPTPWDERIAAFEEQTHYGGLNADGRMGLAHHHALAEGYHRGYADAQARYAPLLEALIQPPTEQHPGPFHEWPDDLLLLRISHLKAAIEGAQKELYEAETTALVRMTERGATSIPSEAFLCVLESSVTYEQAAFTPLREIFLDADLAKVYIPEHQETVLAKWRTQQVIAAAKRYGAVALAVVEKARVEGRPRLKFERR